MTTYKESEDARSTTSLQTMRFAMQMLQHTIDNKPAILDALRAQEPALNGWDDAAVLSSHVAIVARRTASTFSKIATMPVGYPPERMLKLIGETLATFEKDDLSVL